MKCLIVVFLKLARLKVSYDLSQLLPSVSTDIATSLKMLLKRTALEIVVRKPVVILRGEPFDVSSNLFHEFTE